MAPIQVLIVDDSAVSRDLLAHIIESDPSLEVIGKAENGEEALQFIEKRNPDIVLMDIVMPKMDGFEATRKIMERSPLPIVIVTGLYNPKEVKQGYRALSAGALAILGKPAGLRDPKYAEISHSLIQAIKVLANVKIKRPPLTSLSMASPATPSLFMQPSVSSFHAIGIGASIGGPQALSTILSSLPSNFPVPIIALQQLSTDFNQGLADWLASSCNLNIKLPEEGEKLTPGTVYICPHDCHLEIDEHKGIKLIKPSTQEDACPSINRLFKSMAKHMGAKSIGVLLSGSGNDGVEGVLDIKKAGGVSIIQDEESSLMFDKPQQAIQAGAANQVVPLQQIATTLESLIKIK